MGPPPPQSTLLQALHQLPPGQEPHGQQPPSQEPDDQETYSPESPSADEGDSMSAMSSRLETPTLLKIQLPFQKGKRTESGDAADKELAGQSGFPFRADDDEGSVITVLDGDSSDKGGASTSTPWSALTSGQKRGLEDQTSESLTPKEPVTMEALIPPQEPDLPSG